MTDGRLSRARRTARALAAGCALALGPISAAAADTAIALRFDGDATAARPVLQGRALDLGLAQDARPEAARAAIGRKTRGSGITRVTTPDDPGAFVAAAARAALPAWGARLDPAAGVYLNARVVRFDVEEGWGFVARVKVAWSVNDAKGRVLYDATVTGTAKKPSVLPGASQYNAILSAAALDAVALLVNDPAFRSAIGAEPPAPTAASPAVFLPPAVAPAPQAEEGKPPEAILAELLRLAREGLGDKVLDAFLRRQRFSRPMTADDLVAWKRAGLSEDLIGLALAMSSPQESN